MSSRQPFLVDRPIPASGQDPDRWNRLPAPRASACEQLARGLGFVHACPTCEAEALPGSACGFYSAESLRRHRLDVHGKAT